VFQQKKFKQAFSQASVFTIENHQMSHSYFTCRNKFSDAFHDLPVPNNSTVSALMNCFCDMGMQDRKWSG
jgi:hypothetical protein